MDDVPALSRPPVVVDCDPGHDDVLALAVAAASCDVRAITTVAGNAPLAACTANALAVADLLGLDAPVHAGADRPLVRPPRHSAGLHGESGLAGVDVPVTERQAAATGAVEAIVDAARTEPGLWLVATGPLTNIARALDAEPRLVDDLAGISLMGGGLDGGNVTPAAEYNLWFDPHAAARVFASGVPIRMCGLDVTLRCLVDAEVAEAVRRGGGRVAAFLADVLDASVAGYAQISGLAQAPLHDPTAVMALVAPEVFSFEHLHVAVEAEGEVAEGMTVADRRAITRGRREPPNTWVATDVDVAGFRAVLLRSLESLSPLE